MLVDILLVLAGFVLLAVGGDILVRGAVGLALKLRVTPAVIGLTVVSAGTSLPELVVSLIAQLQGRQDLAIGNVVGSNIFNIGMILGISALVIPLPVPSKTIRLEWPFLGLITILTIVLMRNEVITRGEGALFLVLLVAFTVFMVRLARRDVERQEAAAGPELEEAPGGMGKQVLFSVLGMVMLPLGAELLVRGASSIAEGMGVSERVIGLTVVAMGTSLPELASSLAAALRGRTDVAVGNVIGSCVFNLLAILGVASVVQPLVVAPDFATGDVWWMLAFTLLLAPILFWGRAVRRLDGAVLLVLFAIYMRQLF